MQDEESCFRLLSALRTPIAEGLAKKVSNNEEIRFRNWCEAVNCAFLTVEPAVPKWNNGVPIVIPPLFTHYWPYFRLRLAEMLEADFLSECADVVGDEARIFLERFRPKPQPLVGIDEDDVVQLALKFKDAQQARELRCFAEWLSLPVSLQKTMKPSYDDAKMGDDAQREARAVFVVNNQMRPDNEIVLRVAAWSMTFLSPGVDPDYRQQFAMARADGFRHFAELVAREVLIVDADTPAKLETLLAQLSDGDVVSFLRSLCSRSLSEGLKDYPVRQTKRIENDYDISGIPDSSFSPEQAFLLKELRRDAERPLSGALLETFRLNLDEFSDEEIAAFLGRPIRTIEDRLYKARKKIKKVW